MSAQTSEAPRLTAALWYASLGWSVVPVHKVVVAPDGGTVCSCPAGASCGSKGKHPAVVWERYQRAAATPDQIRVWFEGRFASHGVGIITGAVSGFFVIDVDEGPGKAGGDAFNDLQFLHGDIPFTVRARTGGGGKHILLQHPKDIWVRTARNVLAPGVDVRGDGGFIVAAPSMHESGRIYLWDETAHPRVTPIAPAPAWVLEMAEGPSPDAGGNRAPPTGSGEIIRDAWGKVIDGRERFMVGIVCGCIATMKRETGVLPTVEAVVAEAWPTYERAVRARGASLEADGRGITLLRQRVGHFLGRVERGQWKPGAGAGKREAPPFNPETGEVIAGPHVLPPKPAIRLYTMRELDALPPPEWLIQGLLPERGLIVPFGPPKSGKTFIVLSMCLHIAAGQDWFGHPVKQGAVVYIAGEGSGGLQIRLRAMRAAYQIGVDEPFFAITRAVNFRLAGEVAALAAAIRATVGDLPVRMVVIDTLARAMPGADENSAQEVGLVIAGCDALRDTLGCSTMPIHHSGKDETRGARGTSALRGAWDTALEIAGSGKRATMTVADQKEAEAGQRLAFRMDEIPVGIGRTSLAPRLDETPETDRDMSLSRRDIGGQTGIALQVLRDVLAGPEAAIVPWFSGMPDGDVTGLHIETWRHKFYEKMPSVSQDSRKKAFQRAVEKLTKDRFIGVRDPWVWLG
jgi:hypothetical protein